MPFFYKGAGPGTHWHPDNHNAQTTGFTAWDPLGIPSIDCLIRHVCGNSQSPYISLTRSYSVACTYAGAGWGPTPRASPSNPGYVYTISLDDPLPSGLILYDPTKEIAATLAEPISSTPYQHDGWPGVILGILDIRFHKYLKAPIRHPGKNHQAIQFAHVSPQLRALVHTLRDAEILGLGRIPPSHIHDLTRVF